MRYDLISVEICILIGQIILITHFDKVVLYDIRPKHIQRFLINRLSFIVLTYHQYHLIHDKKKKKKDYETASLCLYGLRRY